ncbi:MAG: hypothetical protein M3Q49_08185 [Actinomycetota bacterium]|nr:hypothetical protein [Actinomycetota bacterium]
MSDLRRHNDLSLRDWLDSTYPERIAGRVDPETPMSKKMRREARVPLKSGVLRRLDDPSLYASDRQLLEIFFGRLSAQKPYHYYAAALTNLLDPTLAGGYVELERLELLARREGASPIITEAARITRAAYEFVLDELECEGFELDVEPADRAKIRELKRDENRIEKARSIFVTERKKHGDDTRAIKKTAAETGYSLSQIRRMTVDLRSLS